MELTKQEILEGNKLIAEFMGGKYQIDGVSFWRHEIWLPVHGMVRFDTVESGNGKILKYHESWDWLMSVVEKIESINSINDEYYTDYSLTVTNFVQNYTATFINRNNTEIAEAEGTTRIEAVYKAVIEFIKWYNLNK